MTLRDSGKEGTGTICRNGPEGAATMLPVPFSLPSCTSHNDRVSAFPVQARPLLNTSGPILLISWAAPPATSGSAIIVGNLARQFTRQSMVVAGEWPYNAPPVHWRDDWPELNYVQSVWPFTRRGIRWWRSDPDPLCPLAIPSAGAPP